MMYEYGEQFWGSNWQPLYGFLGGNPLAAMPSLHFALSVQAAHVLSETGPVAGAIGWAYATTLGVALVYLGEHYVVDLAAGLALTEAVRRGRPAGRAAVRPRRGAGSRGSRRRRAGEDHESPGHSQPDRARGGGGARGASAPARPLRPQPGRVRGLRRARDRRAVLPAAAGRRPRGDLAPARGRQPGLARGRAAVHARHVRRLRAALPRRLRPRRRRAPDAARELPDLHGRAGRHAAVLRRRRGRHRADRVGAAGGRAAAPRRRRQDDRLPRPHLPRLHRRR